MKLNKIIQILSSSIPRSHNTTTRQRFGQCSSYSALSRGYMDLEGVTWTSSVVTRGQEKTVIISSIYTAVLQINNG